MVRRGQARDANRKEVKVNDNLKPCPFCGVEDGDHDEGLPFIHIEQYGRRLAVVCSHCGARSGVKSGPVEAKEAWNTRADDACILAGEPRQKCIYCNGDGYMAKHDPSPDAHDGDGNCLGTCPVQVQCPQCDGTGFANKPKGERRFEEAWR